MASFEGTFDPYPQIMKKYSILNTILLIATFVGISLFLLYLSDKCILTNDFYDRNQQPLTGIPEMEPTIFRTVQRVVFLYSAGYLIVKLLVITLIIYTGLYFFEIRASFSDLLRIVTLSEFIFLVPAIVKIWWFYYYVPEPTLERWEDFYFLSLAWLNDYVKPVSLYPLQTFNVFEIGYWFILAAGIRSLTRTEFDRSLKVVVSSYVPALLLWIVLVAFFTIMYFPQAY